MQQTVHPYQLSLHHVVDLHSWVDLHLVWTADAALLSKGMTMNFIKQLWLRITGQGKQDPQPPTPCDDCEYIKCNRHPKHDSKPGEITYRYFIQGQCLE